MKLVVVEVLQGIRCLLEQFRNRVGRAHQQSLVADEVDRHDVCVGHPRQHGEPPLLGPVFGGQQRGRGAVGQRSAVARGERTGAAAVEGRAQFPQLLQAGIGPNVVIAGQTGVFDHQVVEEASGLGARRVQVAGLGQGVLLLAGDFPLFGRQLHALAHGKVGSRFLHVHQARLEMLRPQRKPWLQPLAERAPPGALQKDPPVSVRVDDGKVADAVGAAGDACVDQPGGNFRGDQDRSREARAAGALDVECRCLGREARGKHGFPGKIEVPGMLDHRSQGHVAQSLAGQAVLADQGVEYMGHHVQIGSVSIGGMGACKRDSQTAHDRHGPGRLITHVVEFRRSGASFDSWRRFSRDILRRAVPATPTLMRPALPAKGSGEIGTPTGLSSGFEPLAGGRIALPGRIVRPGPLVHS